jgi:hypothetical protein
MNTRTAHSQYMGAMIWGVSSALHEATEIDRRDARYVNNSLADYLVPVNADIQNVDVIIVPENAISSIPLASRALESWAMWAPLRPLPTQSIMRQAFASDNCRSGLKTCWRPRRPELSYAEITQGDLPS